MPKLTRTLAAAAVAAVLVLGAPLAANATPSPYTPPKPDSWGVTIHAGTVVTHDVPSNTFDASSPLTIKVTGTSPAPTLGGFTASQLGSPMTSNASGGAVVRLDFGASTLGVYDVTLLENGTSRSSYGVVTVIPATDPAVAESASTSTGALATTGTRIDYAVLWGAAAAIAIGAALWLVTTVRRRRPHSR